jgi:hypothetical protein
MENIMLKFELSDLELCWLHGFKSFHQNMDEDTNPYRHGTKQAHYWREGWWEAFFNTDKLSDTYTDHYSKVDVESMAS